MAEFLSDDFLGDGKETLTITVQNCTEYVNKHLLEVVKKVVIVNTV